MHENLSGGNQIERFFKRNLDEVTGFRPISFFVLQEESDVLAVVDPLRVFLVYTLVV